MLLIACPWCGPRDEVEFRYGGQAHIAYPARSRAPSTITPWADFLFLRDNPKGRSASAGATRPVAAAGSTSSATPPPTGFCACTGWASEAPGERRPIDRIEPLAFEFDGQQLTGFAGDSLASALLANDVRIVGPVRSSAGRGACSRRAPRSRMRSCACRWTERSSRWRGRRRWSSWPACGRGRRAARRA